MTRDITSTSVTESLNRGVSFNAVLSWLYHFFEFFFLFFTMCFPVTLSGIRFVFMLGWLAVILLRCLNKKLAFPTHICIIFTIYYFSAVVSAIQGFAFGSAGFFTGLRFDFIYPIIFLIICSSFDSKKSYQRLVKYLLIIQTVICVWDLWYCLYGFNLVPFPSLLLSLPSEYSFGNYGFFVQYFTNHMITHIFMFPIILAISLKKNKLPFFVLLFMELICIVISGRAALQLMAFFSAILIIFFFFLIMQTNKLKSFYLVGGAVLLVLVLFILLSTFSNVSASGIFGYAKDKINNSFSSNDSLDTVRLDQLVALTNGFLDKPLFGNGTASYTLECVRDELYPWNYELYYNLILFQKGIFGLFAILLIYGTTVYGIYKTKRIDVNVKAGFLFAFISVIVSSAFDPYLATSGCLWMIYIPLSFSYHIKEERKDYYEHKTSSLSCSNSIQ